jgi:hypothetical protein
VEGGEESLTTTTGDLGGACFVLAFFGFVVDFVEEFVSLDFVVDLVNSGDAGGDGGESIGEGGEVIVGGESIGEGGEVIVGGEVSVGDSAGGDSASVDSGLVGDLAGVLDMGVTDGENG